jgi:hypothetical protein
VATMLPLFSGTFQAPIVAALFMRGFYLEGLILRALAARGHFTCRCQGETGTNDRISSDQILDGRCTVADPSIPMHPRV